MRTTLCNMLIATMITATWVNGSYASDVVTLRLHSGKQYTARIDPRTDDDKVWLRYGQGSTKLLRGVSWDQIESASRDGESIDNSGIRELAQSAADSATPARPSRVTVGATGRGGSFAQQARRALGMQRRVTSVSFDAHLANWDGDVEQDGLIVHLYPTGAQRQLIEARGVLHVEFVTTRTRRNGQARTRGVDPIDSIGKWTVRVDATSYGERGATLKLPFKANHPEFDTSWSSHGLVHVRFTAPGHGVFHDSIDGVRARPYSSVRDDLERRTGRRFFDGETTGRGNRVVN